MSYILNALRKSEKERQAMQPETVTDRILEQQPDQNRSTVKWVAIAILGNILIIGGLIGFLQNTSDTPAVNHYSKLPAIKNTDLKPSNQPLTETVADQKLLEQLPPPAPTKLSEKEQDAAYKPPKNQLKPSPKKIKIPFAANKATSKSLTSAQTEAEKPKPVPVSSFGIPFLKELSYDFRQSVPKMAINVFVYASDPADRFVIINMAKYKTGQQTKDNVEIKEIRQDSLVVNYRNQTFRIERP